MKVWIEAARPRTLSAAVAPVIVGTAAAEILIAWRFLAALVVALSLQIGVNYANDLFDGLRGVDTAERLGPRRAVASGAVTPGAMKLAMILALFVGAAVGLTLVAAVGPELLVVGAASILAALAYSGGSKPYASRGLGEVAVFIFFGIVATVGSAYVQDETLSRVAYAASIPIGLFATAILVVNNLRDIPTDSASGKTTLAVRLGAPRTRRLYQWLIGSAFVCTLAVAAVASSFLPLFGLVAAPLAVRPVGLVLDSDEPRGLIEALVKTGRLQLVYAALLAVGLWVA
jgi:1,4-dihydroxy-2-naphthoate octaprenyltransferase